MRLAHTANSYQGREPLTDDTLRAYAPSIFAEDKHASRSERYAYIPTIHVLSGLRKEGFLPFYVAQSRTRHEDRREFTKHLLRFRHVNHINALAVGTEFPEISLLNSHDGTSSYQMDAGIYRLVCSNGLLVDVGDVQSLKVPHKGDVRSQVIEAAYEIVDSFPVVQSKMIGMKETKLIPAVQEALAEEAIKLRYDDPETAAPITAAQVLTPKRSADGGNDAWSVFNRTQEHLVRGGLNGTAANGRRRQTRPVTSIQENVKLNKALWSLTERVTAILRGETLQAA
jgi:Domain of unknown function (DUF932)